MSRDKNTPAPGGETAIADDTGTTTDENVTATAPELVHGGDELRDGDTTHADDVTQDTDTTPTYIEVDGRPVKALGERLSTLLKNPDLQKRPRMVVPGLAAAGRVTMLAAREKVGKSTYAAFLGALLSSGGSWGQQLAQGTVLWIGLEEHKGDAVVRFATMGADPDHTVIIDELPGKDRLTQLKAAILRWRPSLIILDSLAAYAQELEDENNAAACTALLTPLVKFVHTTETALVILHHGNKSNSGYRGSVAIGAAMDLILEMTEDSDKANARRITAKGRLKVKSYEVLFDEATESFSYLGEVSALAGGGRLDSAAKRQEIKEGVLQAVRANPGVTKTLVRAAVVGNVATIDKALETLVAEGAIRREGERGGYFPMDAELPSAA